MRPRPLIFAALLGLSACGPGAMPPSVGHPLAGGQAPRLGEIAGASSDAVGLPGAGQTRVTVVDFWASWCAGCQESIPALDALYRDKREEGLKVVGVSVDENGSAAFAMAEALHASFPIVVDADARFSRSYHVAQVPLTFVVDQRGTVRWVGRDPSAIRRAVEIVLAE
jgi:cytochrome c biogenesis protein CcmG, thiol:disulfide interchange protein DsbE